MNKNIQIMITLQKQWDTVQEARKKIERNNKTITFWEDEFLEFRSEMSNLQNAIINSKKEIKVNELLLAEYDSKIKKLEERRNHLKSEKEILAVGREIDQLKKERGAIEEKLIFLLDSLAESEEKFKSMKMTEQEKEKQIIHDVEKLKRDSSELEIAEKSAKGQFDNLLNDIDFVHQSKFLKLINSKDNKAIGSVHGEICEHCNFKIPPFLAIDAGKDDRVVSCTNCGRFIYKI